MTTELVEVQPRELQFVFESKKQSSCEIQLISNSDQYVAFKVKTTSPKKYCVRPNIGIIKPKATCDFTVIMQAQRVAPPDLQCKDKFLIQSTVVPFGTSEEDITSDMFAKDSGKYIEDKKLKVVLVSPPNSPVLLPVNGVLKQDAPYETSPQKEKELGGLENIPPPDTVLKDEGFKFARVMDESIATRNLEPAPNNNDEELKLVKNVVDVKLAKDAGEMKLKLNFMKSKINEVPEDDEFKFTRDMDESRTMENLEPRANDEEEELKMAKNVVDVKSAKDVEDMKLKLKLNLMNTKINEAELTITKLTEERTVVTKEKEMLKQELEVLRRKGGVREVQVGFPLLFVVMVSLISLALGYYMHL